ncbi:hypothetical protein [Ethanoligenens harbinense]|uniref:Uncharacterized protein n=1 Tax=Ethanoligenens harbinense (strain DSM 18485 / JCM 12961 / CGMCC 1.5033 / YUAN-3) TaxID=663278 RepID=E6U4R5_ETHHY|nr:hypothetical protein [Ethanoligenens harbinense]ADU27800.1 hypothetical protein Ethha_2287 [Ethanoligenens harbinense YUAN-3]AVQ96823.1 hypothetical protein CXQ68_11765 [Ethanoligenens harbinense YUAN-3]AYF39485.1 hypothetical protein CXP51_11660 [Ethanoligenens harbinense]AYF42310.1 hypothetical protein CN246_12210 [Ethanoligenens harbinense]QCN93064.1 hypothetical protein DRA42_11800 [Ethanoligenens harbinense]
MHAHFGPLYNYTPPRVAAVKNGRKQPETAGKVLPAAEKANKPQTKQGQTLFVKSRILFISTKMPPRYAANTRNTASIPALYVGDIFSRKSVGFKFRNKT